MELNECRRKNINKIQVADSLYTTSLLLCNKLPQNIVFKAVKIYYLTVPLVQKSGSSLARWLWFSVSHESTDKVRPEVRGSDFKLTSSRGAWLKA